MSPTTKELAQMLRDSVPTYRDDDGVIYSVPHEAASEIERLLAIEQRAKEGRPKVVTLCGSTRFHDAFQEANFRETMAGRIVLSVGFYPHTKSAHEYLEHGEHVVITENQKEALDDLHKRKIDMSDEILVLNVGGYIGASTRSEIEHAERTGKPVRYLEGEPRG